MSLVKTNYLKISLKMQLIFGNSNIMLQQLLNTLELCFTLMLLHITGIIGSVLL